MAPWRSTFGGCFGSRQHFWIAAVVYLVFPWWARSYWAPNGVDGATVALTFLFLNGWSPEMFNAVVPGGWSIATEFGFYAIFPVLVTRLRSIKATTLAAALCLLLLLASAPATFSLLAAVYPKTPTELLERFQTKWLPGALYTFLAGMTAWRATSLRVSRRAAEIEVGGSLLMILVLPFVQLPLEISTVGPSLAFAILVHGLASGGGRYLVSGVVARIGVVSFSVYLWHFEVIMLLRSLITPAHGWHGVDYALWFLVTLAITYAISEVSYRLIERPMMDLGANIARGHPSLGAQGSS